MVGSCSVGICFVLQWLGLCSIVSINALMLTSPSTRQEVIYFPTSLNATQPRFDMLVKVTGRIWAGKQCLVLFGKEDITLKTVQTKRKGKNNWRWDGEFHLDAVVSFCFLDMSSLVWRWRDLKQPFQGSVGPVSVCLHFRQSGSRRAQQILAAGWGRCVNLVLISF